MKLDEVDERSATDEKRSMMDNLAEETEAIVHAVAQGAAHLARV